MKKLSFFLGLATCVLVFLALSAGPAYAQGETGSVTGLVTDPQGGTVAGADVTLTDIGTKAPRTTTTNDSGRYHFASVPAGMYDVTISKSGFKVFKASAQKVSVSTQLTLDVALEVGALTETVVVTSQAGTELQTSNASVGNTVSARELENLPNMGRDATTLLVLQPGVTPTGFVAGAYFDQNTFSIDGGNNTDDMAGNTVGYIQNFATSTGGIGQTMASGVVATPIESVEEFKVNTFGQTADFNSSSGAQVQMVTKRGTDQIHGTGYGYYYAPNIWGANSWVNNHTPFSKGIVPVSRPACAPGTTYQSGDNNCVMPFTPIIPTHRSRFGFNASGPVIPKKFVGGKTYLFVNYEGFRFPNIAIFERSYPTAAMRAGVIQVPDASGVFQPYNLNPFPVTVQVGSPTSTSAPLRTVTLAPATNCPGVTVSTPFCDPRSIGINPIVNQLWGYGPAGGPPGTVLGQAFLPLPNDPLAGDKYNYTGYLGTIRYPVTSNNYVGRIDHDFGPKQHFFGSFRAFKLLNTPTNRQIDVGGLLPGATFGQYVSKAQYPQLGELMVLGLTSSLTSRVTNDLRLSYLWNWWQWASAGGPPQLAGLGGAVEIAPGNANTAESTGAFIPYNVNTQQVRQRIWDGQDKMIRDDVSWVKGNHLWQFGGLIQNNYDFHNRSDNGSGVNNQITYQVAAVGISWTASGAPWIPTTVPSSQRTLYSRLASEVLGMVGQTQVAYARAGSDLSLQPIGASAFDQSTIRTYNVYFTDTWKWKRTVTLNYGLGYTYETPPVEKNGKQVALVYQDGSLVDTADFLAKRKAAALAGQVYNPIIGFATTNALKLHYPYNPFRNGWSPRASVAWNPSFKSGLMGKLFGDGKTVLRGGYSLTWGRLNGVNLVLVPLLGVGLLQSVSCTAPDKSGTCASTSRNPTNIFRIGTDGSVAPLPAGSATLPQPFFTGGSNPQAQDATMLDPNYKPEKVHNFDFTVQRQLGRKVSLEVGYMGRKISNVFQEINLDAVPYMTTLGGQTFAQAYANLYLALAAGGTPATQAFLEAAFNPATAFAAGGFCNGFATCTAAVANKQGANVVNGNAALVWQALNGGTGWVLGRTMISAPLIGGPTNCTTNCQGQATTLNMTTSLGFSNYNAMFITMRLRDWHGLSGISNFTWGRSLGTGELAQYNSSNTALDPWNLRANYGPQNFDIKAIFNAGLSYQPNSFFGLVDFRNKKGILGQLLTHWTIAPLFTYQSGGGTSVVTAQGNGGVAFGEVGNPNGNSGSTAENAVMVSPFTGGNTVHYGVVPSAGPGSSNQAGGLNLFADPAAVFAQFRPCILGLDTSCGGYYTIRNPHIWNLDAAVAKEFRFRERLGIKFSVQFTNLLNHFAPAGPSTAASTNALSLANSSLFGVINSQAVAPRSTEFGLRVSF